ncbi:hypothetical protein [Actinosynnema mirum]|uniref:Mce-associated membrane protein n=1 Tax=Actinosynnema mirum (strain ATCC 29888 / DSM 43827 / JCM 3225 / NBRC 14064 / NCIMB 13271 / NRRL B-12336 / IMRU 3971 / 101) TaxID=446462 RepID=C6WN62_ACTMD|nr:hypothetical protein [Actinosynnema mirum]ACU40426.1 hypothetical protein Amir_6629 [Actinosynnema mirum DSM 43827]
MAGARESDLRESDLGESEEHRPPEAGSGEAAEGGTRDADGAGPEARDADAPGAAADRDSATPAEEAADAEPDPAGGDSPGRGSPGGDGPGGDSPTEDQSAEGAPAEDAPVGDSPDGDAPVAAWRSGGARGWGRVLPVAVVLVVLSAGYALWAGMTWWSASTGDSVAYARERDEVLRVGQVGVVNFTTLDFRKVDEDLDRWLDSSTGDLRREVEEGRQTRREQIEAAKTVTTSRVLDAAVTELDARAGTAALIAVVETTVAPEGGQPVKKINRYRTALTRTDAGWKLAALGPVAAGGA